MREIRKKENDISSGQYQLTKVVTVVIYTDTELFGLIACCLQHYYVFYTS